MLNLNSEYFKDFDNIHSIRFVDGDDFERLIFKKMIVSIQDTLPYMDSFKCCGHDSRYTKFIAYDHMDYECGEPVQIFVDRADNYKPRFFYGHDGWLC